MSQAVTLSDRSRPGLYAVSSTSGVLAAVTLVGALLRFVDLPSQSFWAEEAITRSLVRMPLGTMLHTIPHSESTPPVYYVMAWGWTRVFGFDELGLRSLSATIGTLTIPAAYLASRALTRERSAAFAVAAFVAVSPIMVWYSQESRSYASYIFFSTVSLIFFGRALRSTARRDLWLWAVAACVAMATHYCAGFLVVGETLVLLYRRRRSAVLPVGVAAFGALLLAPLALYQHDHVLEFQDISNHPVATRMWEVLQRRPFVSYNPGRDATLVVVWSVIAICAWRARRVAEAPTALLLSASAVLLPVALVLTRTTDLFTFRNVLSGWVPLAIGVAPGLPASGRLRAAAVGAGCLVLLAPTLAIATKPTLQRDSWRSAIAAYRVLPPAPRALISQDYFTAPQYWSRLHRTLHPIRVRELDYVSRYATPTFRVPAYSDFKVRSFRIVGNMGFVRLRAPRLVTVDPAKLPPGIRVLADLR